MACIGSSTDTSHFNIAFKVKINILCFFLAVFSDSEYLNTPSSEKTASSSYCNNPLRALSPCDLISDEFHRHFKYSLDAYLEIGSC